IQDLNVDSLDLVELFMAVEDGFGVSIPDDPPNMAYKSVFTRNPFRLRDFAELVYLQQGCGRLERLGWWGKRSPGPVQPVVPFTQLDGSVEPEDYRTGLLFESLGKNEQGFASYRRRTDGMVCVKAPGAEVMIGADEAGGSPDE